MLPTDERKKDSKFRASADKNQRRRRRQEEIAGGHGEALLEIVKLSTAC